MLRLEAYFRARMMRVRPDCDGQPGSGQPRPGRRWLAPSLIVPSLLALCACAAALQAGRSGPVSDILVETLEQRFERVGTAEAATFAGVIALGGNDDRIREAAGLARRWPHLRVLVTGAGSEERVLGVIGAGIARDRILIETEATNTWENAILSAATLDQRLPDARGTRWLLVTSAAHMPRSMGAFRRAGVSVAPWPIYDLAQARPKPIEVARHEWLGLAGYWLRGRSSALFPAPERRAPMS